MNYPNRLIDKRVVDRYIAKGMVDREQYKALIGALPDMEANAVTALSGAADDDWEDEPEPGPPAGRWPPPSL